MKKTILGLLLVIPFIFGACGKSVEQSEASIESTIPVVSNTDTTEFSEVLGSYEISGSSIGEYGQVAVLNAKTNYCYSLPEGTYVISNNTSHASLIIYCADEYTTDENDVQSWVDAVEITVDANSSVEIHIDKDHFIVVDGETSLIAERVG